MDLLEVIEEFLFDILMLLYLCSFLILDERYVIMHPSLHCGSMEEFCVALSFFKPSNSRLLPPVDFLLLPSLLQLAIEASFLFQGGLSVPFSNDFVMEL